MTIRTVRFARALPAALLAFAAAPALAADPVDPPFHRHFRSPARLGLEVQGMSPELRAFFKAPPDAGVLVSQVEPGSPAAEAGLVVGDVLVEAGGEKLEGARDLVWKAMRAPEGEPLALVVIHEGAEKKLDVVPRGEPQPPFWDREELFGPGQADAIRELREALQKIERRLEEIENRMAKPEKRT